MGTARAGCGQPRDRGIWNVDTQTPSAARAFEPVLEPEIAAYLEFAGDDRCLVIGAREGIDVVEAGQLALFTKLYHRDVTLTAMQRDGTIAATMGKDGIVRVWKTIDGGEIARIDAGSAGQEALALSNDGRWLATLEDAGTFHVWALTPADLIEQACRWLPGPCP